MPGAFPAELCIQYLIDLTQRIAYAERPLVQPRIAVKQFRHASFPVSSLSHIDPPASSAFSLRPPSGNFRRAPAYTGSSGEFIYTVILFNKRKTVTFPHRRSFILSLPDRDQHINRISFAGKLFFILRHNIFLI